MKRTSESIICIMLITSLLIISTVLMYLNGAVYSEDAETIRQTAIMQQTYEGSFISSDGTVLTKSDQPYMSGRITEEEAESFAWIIGTPATSGLRNTMSSYLYDGSEKNDRGDDIWLSIDRTLQNYAYSSILNGEEGSVTILENKTGRILALASHSDVSLPAFDLNEPDAFLDVCDSVNESLYIRGIYETDPPGSTFKIITAAAALRKLERKKLSNDDFEYFDSGYLETPDGAHVITNYADRDYGDTGLAKAFCVSCNTYFANLALKTGWEDLCETADEFLVGKEIDIPFLGTLRSTILTENKTPALLAMTGIGQGNLTVTPLHLALIGSAAANGGNAYRPTVVDEIRTSAGRSIYKVKPEKIIRKVLSRKSSKTLLEALHESALYYGLDEENLGTVYAKTGTAETPSGIHSYIVVFTDTYSFCLSFNRGKDAPDLYDKAWQLAYLCNHEIDEGGE